MKELTDESLGRIPDDTPQDGFLGDAIPMQGKSGIVIRSVIESGITNGTTSTTILEQMRSSSGHVPSNAQIDSTGRTTPRLVGFDVQESASRRHILPGSVPIRTGRETGQPRLLGPGLEGPRDDPTETVVIGGGGGCCCIWIRFHENDMSRFQCCSLMVLLLLFLGIFWFLRRSIRRGDSRVEYSVQFGRSRRGASSIFIITIILTIVVVVVAVVLMIQ